MSPVLQRVKITTMTSSSIDSNSSPIDIVKSVKTAALELSTLLESVPKGSGFELTDREYEALSAHVEWERVCHRYHDNSDDEPNQRKAPEQEADYQTGDIEFFPGLSDVRDCCGQWKVAFVCFSEGYQSVIL